MSEVVGGTSADFGVDNEWTDVDEQESGAVEGFEEWGAALPTKTVEPNGKVSAQKNAPVKGSNTSQELGLFEADTDTTSAADYHEDGKNVPGGDNWSWGAAWSAFTTAVQQVRALSTELAVESMTTFRVGTLACDVGLAQSFEEFM